MLGALSVSHTGLNASRYAIDNIGNNQANENTPGYKKRVVDLNEIGQINGLNTGRGVYFDGVYRVTSQYMYDKLIGENSKDNYLTKVSNLVGSVESVFKETDNSGFSAELNNYYQSLENLRTNPSSQIYKSEVKRNGEIVVNSLKNKYSSIQEQQKYENNEFKVNIDKVNGLLGDIAKINDQIQKNTTATNDLLDKRDLLELELSQYVDIKVSRDDNFYELKIGDQTVLSNGTNVQKINSLDLKTNQIDKFNYIKYNSDNTFQIYDSLKTNSDFSSKNLTVGDTVTLKINNQYDVSVKIGDNLSNVDLGDGNGPVNLIVDENNLTRVMTYLINTDANLKGTVTAYNGDYSIDSNGKKITNNTQDNYLRLESNLPGIENKFDSRVSIERADNTLATTREVVYRNDFESKDAKTDIGIAIYDKEINLSSGIMKAQIENLSSSSPNNHFQDYLNRLDSFSNTLADISSKYIKLSPDNYIYGSVASEDTNKDKGEISTIGLFSGSGVESLKFNSNVVDELKQPELDYLATIQWKNDLNFDGKGQLAPNATQASLNDYFRDLRITISADKETTDFLKSTQEAIHKSIESSYNNLVKVDKDDEMLNLMKFQASFTANAQVITAVNEMIQTILGMRR